MKEGASGCKRVQADVRGCKRMLEGQEEDKDPDARVYSYSLMLRTLMHAFALWASRRCTSGSGHRREEEEEERGSRLKRVCVCCDAPSSRSTLPWYGLIPDNYPH
eukprot:7492669-Pyramimonas_sp.AAC.1